MRMPAEFTSRAIPCRIIVSSILSIIAVAAHIDLVTAHVAADEAQRESQVRQRAEPAPLGKTKFLIEILVKAAVPILVAVGYAIKARVSAGAVRGA